jgi:dihydroneopterin aldolase
MTLANASPRPTELQPAAETGAGLRRMFVRDLVLDAHIGVRAYEKGRRQRIRLNLDLGVLDTESTDKLESVVCYDDLIAAVRVVVGEEHLHLIETLAERIAEACFRDRKNSTSMPMRKASGSRSNGGVRRRDAALNTRQAGRTATCAHKA